MNDPEPITFLFTDIEGSSTLWESATEVMERSVARHEVILTDAIQANDGWVVKTLGDGLYAAFPSAADGVTAALNGMRGLLAEPWPEQTPISVRMGLHTGPAIERDGDFFGPSVNRTARLEAAAHGGQIVLSSVTAQLATQALPDAIQLLDIGEVRLRGFSSPERVSQVLADGLASEFPPLVGSAAPNNLPAPATSFLGREQEMSEVLEVLEASRLVTITGFGGTGKTRMAVEAAAAATAGYPDGVWFVDLAPVQSPELVTQTIASTLGIDEEPGRELAATVAHRLIGDRVLIVIDNCEHLIEKVSAVLAALLAATNQLSVLATSRQRLNVPGELVFELAPLSVDENRTKTGSAVQLFLDRARAARHGFTALDEELEAIVDICARLDGIPLAIELAAARVRLLRPTQIAARLDDRFRLLVGGPRTALPRQQTLHALVDWSFELLSDEERALFRRLSVFAGNFTVEAAEAVCSGDGVDERRIFDDLASLVDQSLAQIDNSAREIRFILLETLRVYGGEQLEMAGEVDSFRERHAAFFATTATGADERLKGSQQGEWHRRFEADVPDLLLALAWLTENKPQAALEMAAELGRLWYRRGMTTPGRDITAAALAAADQEPTVARGRALGWLGYFVDVLGDADEAWRLTLEALEVAKQLDDNEGMAFALNGLGNRADNAGRARDAGDYWQQAIAALDRAGSASVVSPLFNLGVCLVELGDLDEARPVAERLIDIAEETDNLGASAQGHLLLGQIAHGQGRLDDAERDTKTALAMFFEQGVVFEAAEASLLQCRIAELRGDVETAKEEFERARALLADTNAFEGTEARLLAMRIALRDRDLPSAAANLRAALEVGRGSSNPLHLVSLLHESARLAVLAGRNRDALLLLGAAQEQREVSELRATAYEGEEGASVVDAVLDEIDEGQVRHLTAEGSRLEPTAALRLAESLLV